jgi:nitrate reductase gamma subunit
MLFWVIWYLVVYVAFPLFIIGLVFTLGWRDFTWIVDGRELLKDLIRRVL